MAIRRRLVAVVGALSSSFVLSAGRAAAQEPPAPAAPASQPAAPPEPPATPAPEPAAEPVAPAPPEPPAEEKPSKEKVEEIVVTGSRVRRKDLNTPAPVTVLSRSQWEQSGKITLGDFLQSMPEQGNAPNFQLNNGGISYNADGGTRINLRSLGVTRTLVLVNGRRMVPSGLGASPAPDLNSIPAAAVERIEVLKDGASAIYGSDAIAGVVNIITRKSYDGAEASAEYGISGHGDAQTVEVSAITGRSGPRGSFIFSASFFDQGDSWLRDRGWADKPLTYDYAAMNGKGEADYFGSHRIPQGAIQLPKDADGKPLPDCLKNTLCKGLIDLDPMGWGDDYFMPDSTKPLGWRVLTNADTYNYAAENYLTIPSRRVSIFSNGDSKWSWVRAFYEASYVQRNSSQNAAPFPLNPGDYTYGGGSVPIVVSKDSLYNPFGVDLPFAGRRLVEFGHRTYDEELGTFRLVGGLDGTLDEDAGPLKGWNWDAAVNYGRTSGTYTTGGAIRNSRVADAVGPSMKDPVTGDPICVSKAGDASTAIPGCVPINLFGGPNNGSIDPGQINNLGFSGTSRAYDQLLSVDADLTGPLFKLPSGRSASLGVGYEFRHQEGAQIADPIAASGDSADFNFKSTDGSFNVHEGHAELALPLYSDAPGVDELELSLAGRVVSYDTFGSNFSYKVGARYSPVHDITLRGTYSTAFRAPSISELYLGQSETAPSAQDPCGNLADPNNPAPASLIAQCKAAGVPTTGSGDQGNQELTRVGGNKKLDAETAHIITAGLVVQPRFASDLSFTVDFYDMTVDNLIGNLGASAILNGCYPGDKGTPNPALCALVTRAGANKTIQYITDLNANVGKLETAGIDFAVRYNLRTDIGRWAFLFDATWLAFFDRTQNTGTGTQTIHGGGNYDLGALPDLKANLAINWAHKGWGAGGVGRFVSSFTECALLPDKTSGGGLCYAAADVPSRGVGVNFTFDLHASYSFSDSLGKTTISVGLNNVLDTDPQYVFNGALANSDPTVYDWLGRYFYARISQTL
jgi:outer membrane receptor protein involved in Fe transport